MNVMSNVSLDKAFFVTGEAPIHTGRFLSPDEHRQQNTEAQRAKRMKMSPDKCGSSKAHR